MKIALFIAALLGFILLPLSEGHGQWTVLSHNSVHHDNKTVFMHDASTGWIGGTDGTIFKTTDGGVSWVLQHTGSTDEIVAVIRFLNSSNGFAIARSRDFGILYVTSNGGDSWIRDTALRDLAVTDSITFADVTFTTFGDSSYIWLTGGSDTGSPVAYHQYVYLSTDTGKTWTRFTRLPEIPYLTVFKFIFFSPDDGVLSGGNVICRTTDGGNSWTQFRLGPENTSYFYSFQFLNADTGFFAGQASVNPNGYLKIGHTYNGGLTWAIDSTNAFSPFYNADMFFINPHLGFDVTMNDNRIFRTTDGGKSWEKYSWTNDFALFDIHTANGKNVVAVGSAGKIIVSDDSGSTWNDVTPLESVQLSYVKFLSNDLVVGLGSGVEFFLSRDSCRSWTEYDMPTGLNVHIAFGDSLNAWISDDSSRIYHSTNSGMSWQQQGNPDSAPFGPPIYGIDFVNNRVGCAVGARGFIVSTTDGGQSWTAGQSNEANDLYSVFVSSSDRAWAVGAAGTILASSGGLVSWTKEYSPVNSTLKQVVFSDTLDGTILGDGGVILKTTDGGSTWDLGPSPDSSLNAMSFIDSAKGWVVGNGGSIFLTTDGGSSWTKEASGTTSDLTGVDFFNDLLGAAVGDSGAVLTTNNGGLTAVRRPDFRPIPLSILLAQNFPNPFNPSTMISYQLPAKSHVTLRVYDVLGREVATLVSGPETAGTHTVTFNGEKLPSGVYFYRLQAGNYTATKKLLLLK